MTINKSGQEDEEITEMEYNEPEKFILFMYGAHINTELKVCIPDVNHPDKYIVSPPSRKYITSNFDGENAYMKKHKAKYLSVFPNGELEINSETLLVNPKERDLKKMVHVSHQSVMGLVLDCFPVYGSGKIELNQKTMNSAIRQSSTLVDTINKYGYTITEKELKVFYVPITRYRDRYM
jgi:hypothetical protein